METKKCPACAEEIKKEATRCPKCQKDLRNWFVRHPILSIILAIFLIGVFGDMTSKQYISDINNVDIENKSTNTSPNGIWDKRYYVDDFGDKTKDGYITTNDYIYGTFSNTATQNSRLKVSLFINNENDIDIKLYEYAGTNPVKAVSYKMYNLYIKDKDGNKTTLKASSRSDRLSLKDSSEELHNIFLKGGKIDFIIKDVDFPSEYSFSIKNADGYSILFK